jgi:Tol biopolymer transport system component
VRAEDLDARTDLFSLGIVLYEMVSGRLPFSGSSSGVVFEAILNRPPTPLVARNPQTPPKLEEIISKCLEKDRAFRYQHAADVRADLMRLRRDLDHSAPLVASSIAPATPAQTPEFPRSKPNQPRKLISTIAIPVLPVLFAAAIYGGYAMSHRHVSSPFENFTISQITDTGNSELAALSPDGKYLVRVTNERGKNSLSLRHISTNTDTQIMPPTDIPFGTVAFSPDGNYLYFRKAIDKGMTAFDLYRASILGGNPQLVVHDVDTEVTFSPDGSRVAYVRGENPEVGKFRLLVSDADGKGERALMKGSAVSEGPGLLAWSPDGKQLATNISGSGITLGAIQFIATNSGNARVFRRFENRELQDIVWHPNGSGLFVSYSPPGLLQSQIVFVSVPSGQIREITRDTNFYDSLSISADGKILAAVQRRISPSVFIAPVSGSHAAHADAGTNKNAYATSWTKRGDLLVIDTDGVSKISADGNNKTKIINAPHSTILTVSSCPDGRFVLAWQDHERRGTNIWRLDADGSNEKRLTEGARDVEPMCSADGKWVYFVDGDRSKIKRVSVDGGESMVVPGSETPFIRIGAPALSPDGRQLATLAAVVGSHLEKKLLILSLSDETKPVTRILTPDPRVVGKLEFTRDGLALSYPIRENAVDNLWIQPLKQNPGRQITQFDSDSIDELHFSPDGKKVAIVRTHSDSDVVLLRDLSAAH